MNAPCTFGNNPAVSDLKARAVLVRLRRRPGFRSVFALPEPRRVSRQLYNRVFLFP